jgi:predicted Zn finger-like uncharacterized protein
MSMITRCPACATAYRVTEAQLRTRAGQVRCGRCGAQFDAIASLTSASDSRDSPPRTAGPTTSGGPAPTLSISNGSELDFGPKPRTRSSRLWLPACLLTVLLLAAQGAFRYRSDISVLLPEAKPVFATLCAQLGCEIPLPRRPELLSIESSDLQADETHPSVMILTATLRNRAGFVQAYPALELTLTDAYDQTLARRVLAPPEYAAKTARIASGFAAASDMRIRVYIQTPGFAPTGYRLYLFYS